MSDLLACTVLRAVAGVFVLPLALQAAPASAQAAASVADQTNTMDAQIQILRKQSELNQALALAAGASAVSLPRVLAVFGFGKQLSARLLLSNGAISNYAEGEAVRAGMALASITPRSVLVTVGSGKKSRVLALEFVAGGSSASAVAGVAGPATGLPSGAPGSFAVPPELLPAPPAVNTGNPGALAH